jgi:hypothetical protein
MTKNIYRSIAFLLVMIGIGLDEAYMSSYYCFSIPFFAMSFEVIRLKDNFKMNNKELILCFIIVPILFTMFKIFIKFI